MAITVLKKGSLVLAASVLLVAQAQATELLNSSYARAVCRPESAI